MSSLWATVFFFFCQRITRLPASKYPWDVHLSRQFSRCQGIALQIHKYPGPQYLLWGHSRFWATGTPFQRSYGQAQSAQSPIVKPEVPLSAERERNLNSSLLSKTLKCSNANLALLKEAILHKRYAASLIWRTRERSKWQKSTKDASYPNDSPLHTSLLTCISRIHASAKFHLTSSHSPSVCSHSKLGKINLQVLCIYENMHPLLLLSVAPFSTSWLRCISLSLVHLFFTEAKQGR